MFPFIYIAETTHFEVILNGGQKCQGWQSIDRPGKPRWENPGFPGLGNTPRNCSTGQYWVISYFPPVFIMKYLKTACIVP